MTHKEIRFERNRLDKRRNYLGKCIETVRKQEKQLQNNCEHDGQTIWHQDPAGGSDSWTECCLCGGYVKERK